MLIGYARVSTDDQNLDLQCDALQRAGCGRVFEEKEAGRAGTKRPALEAALAYLRSDDQLVLWKVDRLCTRVRGTGPFRGRRWRVRSWNHEIQAYWSGGLGYLPQGAPTSPMLSNMSARAFDEEVAAIAATHDLRYTRYADDISLSTTCLDFSRLEAAAVVGQVYVAMSHHGMSPNRTKTQIAAPGCRKVVLGLLVDGPEPRLMREFKAGMEVHLHCLTHPEIGPARHAEARGFESILGMQAHLRGLIAHAQSIEPDYGVKLLGRFIAADW